MEPDHLGDVGVDHGDSLVESKELAGDEGESSRPRRAPPPWRGMGSRMVRKERSSSSSSSELSC